ncbi:acyl transferase/acyl hydrolase/lysophospholipase [Pavlovales sp. CCMP2436]|nr:acyl transferase/acyl hydrolase/lysophospholipase [Pavlovales sp. CCMP2436]
MCTSTVRVLSLDGGGMRGLIGATVLEELEVILSDKLGAPARVGDFFDVVVGTSTGGLQAAALMMGHGAVNLSAIYMRDGAIIFSNETRNCKAHHKALIAEHCTLDLYNLGGLLYDCLPALAHCFLAFPAYSTDGIEAVARTILGDLTTAEDFGGRVFGMTTYDLLRGTPITFTNLGATAASTYYMVDAALATSAAPTFFNPRNFTCVGCEARTVSSERVLAADGALYANNPALIAYELAEKMAAERRGCALTPDSALVLSLGTGRQRSDLYSSGNMDLSQNTLGSVLKTVVQFLEFNDTKWWDEQWGTLKWVFLPLTAHSLELLNAALIGQEEVTDQFFKKVFGASGAAERYLRVNVDLSRFAHTTPFDAHVDNVEALRQIGSEAAASARYRLSRFADELIALSPDGLRSDAEQRMGGWGGLTGGGAAAPAAAATALVVGVLSLIALTAVAWRRARSGALRDPAALL